MSNATMNRVALSIDEEAEQLVQDILDKAHNKGRGPNKPAGGSRKPKGDKQENAGRDIVMDPNSGMNFFNAKVCALKIGRLTRGAINSAKINIGEVAITMIRLPKKRDFDPVRYAVQGGGKKEIAAVKTIAIQDMAERIVMLVRKNNPNDGTFQQLLTK
jgi:hypothetical protein